MRNYITPVLCGLVTVGLAAFAFGCTVYTSPGHSAPPPRHAAPPPARQPKAKPAPKAHREAPPKPKRHPPAPKPKKEPAKVEGGQLKLPGPVVFKTGSAELAPESDAVLEVVHDYLAAKPEITLLRIEGHTDSDGNDASNQTLSEQRSMSVAQWLIAHGTDCRRLLPVGFGESKPIADNATPDGKAQNRRTAFINAALKGKPIAGLPVDGGGRVAGNPCK